MKKEKAQFNKDNVLIILKGMELRSIKACEDKKSTNADKVFFHHSRVLLNYLRELFGSEEYFEKCLKTQKSNIRKLGKKYEKRT